MGQIKFWERRRTARRRYGHIPFQVEVDDGQPEVTAQGNQGEWLGLLVGTNDLEIAVQGLESDPLPASTDLYATSGGRSLREAGLSGIMSAQESEDAAHNHQPL